MYIYIYILSYIYIFIFKNNVIIVFLGSNPFKPEGEHQKHIKKTYQKT